MTKIIGCAVIIISSQVVSICSLIFVFTFVSVFDKLVYKNVIIDKNLENNKNKRRKYIRVVKQSNCKVQNLSLGLSTK